MENWEAIEGGVRRKDTGPLDLRQCFFCGQAFRFSAFETEYRGVVGGKAVVLLQQGDNLVIMGAALEDAPFWERYLALDEDYAAMQAALCRNPVLRRAVAHAPGLRVLRQPFFEMLITFILSQNNHIPRITGMVERLCQTFGEEKEIGVFLFPTPQRLAEAAPEAFAPVRAGYRVKAIQSAAQMVAQGILTEEILQALPTPEAKALLCTVYGVGPKVAECVLLFGLGRQEVAPMDVWMQRAMARYFPKGFPRYLKGCEGIAQQYLFHYIRTCPAARKEGKRA